MADFKDLDTICGIFWTQLLILANFMDLAYYYVQPCLWVKILFVTDFMDYLGEMLWKIPLAWRHGDIET